MRINKFIASRLGLSRRKVDQIIQNEEVFVNQQRAQIGQQVAPGDKVICKGQEWVVELESELSSILVYKPVMSLVSTVSQDGKRTIYEILPPYISSYKPAGRLDYMSEGLLVMSQDGDLIYSLTHPSQLSRKVYLVGTNKSLASKNKQQAKRGMEISINDEMRRLASVTIEDAPVHKWDYLNPNPNHHWYLFHLSEGRNNQIRRMCRSFDVKVARLVRVQHGDFKLTKELKEKKTLTIER